MKNKNFHAMKSKNKIVYLFLYEIEANLTLLKTREIFGRFLKLSSLTPLLNFFRRGFLFELRHKACNCLQISCRFKSLQVEIYDNIMKKYIISSTKSNISFRENL
jgi:hypothetical protein